MEKTFDELIEEMNTGGRIPYGIVLSLMQKVRESTIEECFRIANKKDSSIADEISDLPTDRIKIN